jgi:L-amino acid N-acyltransferase YncA
MKFLLDTNAIIPAEPTRSADVEPTTPIVARLIGLIAEGRHQTFVHPVSKQELQQDPDDSRRQLRESLLAKYPQLPSPPTQATRVEKIIGAARPGSNDAIDNLLIEAVLADAVDYFVTNDTGIHKKAAKLGISGRVVRAEDAVTIIRGLFRTSPEPPPAVELIRCHQLNEADPIFASFQSTYGVAEFNAWLSRCKRDHRLAWVVRQTPISENLAGICIVKDEHAREHGLAGSLLKICSFQVAADARGFRFGELLLKAVFQHASKNEYHWIYVEVFPGVHDLIAMLEQFGFEQTNAVTHRGEIVLAKRMTFTPEEYASTPPLAFNRRFGPLVLKLDGADAFMVPIQPHYHDLLFPEEAMQTALFSGRHPFGNSILKAYLCNAQVRQLGPGSVLVFYRSGGRREFRCTGVVEDVKVSRSALEIARFVGQRTVYSYDDIERMCSRDVLAILFRQSRTLHPPVSLDDVIAAGGVAGVPQSITRVKEEGRKWLAAKISP